MSTSGNVPGNEPTRKRGRPRRVIFDDVREPDTPNIEEDPMPQEDQPEPNVQEQQENSPPNEPIAEQLLALLR